jgi:hypothetical protein
MFSRSSDAGRGRPLRAVARLLSWTATNVEGAVYGAVAIGVLLAAEDASRVGYLETVEAALLVLVLYWLTGFFARELAMRLQRREQVNLRLMWRSGLHELSTIEGGLIPVLALLIAWASGASVRVGVSTAVWTTAGTIIALEVAAGYRARPGYKPLLLQASVGVATASAIIVLKRMLH